MKPQRPCIDPPLVRRAGQVLALLKQQKLRLVTAESCTAGLLAAAFAQTDGAGEWLQGGFVTYTKEAKHQLLGVDAAWMAQHGCVNAEVVRQMALGALERCEADIAIAISGVLGPRRDEDDNPLGRVFFCCARRDAEPRVRHVQWLRSTPEKLRRQTVLEALALVVECAEMG